MVKTTVGNGKLDVTTGGSDCEPLDWGNGGWIFVFCRAVTSMAPKSVSCFSGLKKQKRERERKRGEEEDFFLVTRKSGVRLKRLIWPLIV